MSDRQDNAADRYADIGLLLDGGLVSPPRPTIGLRDDGIGLFYAGQVNLLFGHPESGKTWIALAALADDLARGGRGIVIDLDHNGVASVVHRLIDMGVDDVVLRDPSRFRYAAPDDPEHMLAVVNDCRAWRPTVAVVDSLGELLPLFAASSNSADDFTRVHAVALKPLAERGAAVILIDHPSKGAESSSFGSTGTAAKKRAIGGTSLRCVLINAFRPGHGGSAALKISKDRHGGLRAECDEDGAEPLAAVFALSQDRVGDLSWRFAPPKPGQRVSSAPVSSDGDVERLRQLVPPPTSQRDVKARLGMGSTRALEALKAWRAAGAPTALLAPPLQGEEQGALRAPAPGALREHRGARRRIAS